ncbi:hypothetical protein ABIA33_001435 [Streptacidiphilus sp. MAP12-16]
MGVGKGLAGVDEHQVRRWISWHRWVTLAMFTHTFLAVTAAAVVSRDYADHPAARSNLASVFHGGLKDGD